MGELKVADLETVYDMTWSEFQIRLFAYKRQDLYKWQQLRELMWITYIAPHQDPKKMVKRKESLLSLKDDKKVISGVTPEQKERFLKEYLKWQQAVN